MITRKFNKNHIITAATISANGSGIRDGDIIFNISNKNANKIIIEELPFPAETLEPSYTYIFNVMMLNGKTSLEPCDIISGNGKQVEYKYEIIGDSIHIYFHDPNNYILSFDKSDLLKNMLRTTPFDNREKDFKSDQVIFRCWESGLEVIVPYRNGKNKDNEYFIHLTFKAHIHPGSYTYNMSCTGTYMHINESKGQPVDVKNIPFDFFTDDENGSIEIEMNMEGI